MGQKANVSIAVPQLKRCSWGGKICSWGGKNFWVGLLFFKFSVDLPKKGQKNGHRANLVFFSPSSMLTSKKKVISPNCSTYFLVFCWFPKKKPPSWNYRKDKGSLGGHAGYFRGTEFLFREAGRRIARNSQWWGCFGGLGRSPQR